MLSQIIRHRIEERFGRQLRYSKDCEALAASIQRACQERISPTTLKRLFGFAKTVDRPRLYTLDVLAQYIGYPDWNRIEESSLHTYASDAVVVQQNGNDATVTNAHGLYRLNHQISIARASKSIDVQKVIGLAQELGHQPAFIPFITELIGMAASQNNAELLGNIFSLPHLFEPGVHGVYELYYVGQAMGFVLRSNAPLADQLLPKLAANSNARQYLVEWFVDEDYLSGYYGKLLDIYHTHKQEDPADLLFYYALKYKQCLQLGDVVGRIGWYRKIKALSFTQPLYQILAARYIGTCLAEEREHFFQPSSAYYSMIHDYLDGIDYQISLNFVFFLSRELYLHKRTDWLVQLIVDFGKMQTPILQEQKTHLTLNLENQIQVYSAYVAYLLGENKNATALIQNVDINMFDPFIYQQMLSDYASVKKALGM